MDVIDTLLLEAFGRLLPLLISDAGERKRRLRRRQLSASRRPLRAWCLCLRASDTRIVHEQTAFFDERGAAFGERHDVELPGWGIRELVAPVRLEPLGERWDIAADMLGLHKESLRYWMDHGVFEVEHDYCQMHGYRGKARPILRCLSPLDPNATLGRPPEGLWGSMWQYHYLRVPKDDLVTLRRTPRVTGDRRYGQTRRGWKWICPGRRGHKRCGREVQRVFAPLAVKTIHNFIGPEALGRIVRERGATQFNLDAFLRALRDPHLGPLTFACQRCWNIRYTDFSNPTVAWNQFITYISAGLLSGSEVPMPEAYRKSPRRRRRYHRLPGRRESPRRQEVCELWAKTDLTYNQIAQKLKVGYATVHTHIRTLYKQHDVHGREELAEKLREERRRKRQADAVPVTDEITGTTPAPMTPYEKRRGRDSNPR